MKTLHNQKYQCPVCKLRFTHSEWSEQDKDTYVECHCDECFSKLLNDEYGNGVYILQKPSWVGVQKKVLDKTKIGNAQSESIAADVVQQEKRKELATSRSAREYERARKSHWLKNKPEWVRRGRNTAELSQMEA